MKSHELYTLLGEIDSEYILDACPRNTNKEKHTMKRNISKKIMYGALAFAASLALLITGALTFTPTKGQNDNFATITLDVNPSLEIKVDENETVRAVTALNEDAKTVMGDMRFEGSSLELTVNALIGSMVRNGYLNEITNSVLLSVDSKDAEKGITIKEKLAGEIAAMINTESFKGAVISQTVSSDDSELAELAKTYGVTMGKAKLIRAIVNNDSERSFAELVPFSITELNLILEGVQSPFLDPENGPAPEDLPDVDGEASQKGYIGKEKALQTVLEYYNVPKEEVSNTPSIEITIQSGTICYRVQFKRISGNYSYKYNVCINAATGWIAGGGFQSSYSDPNPMDNKGCHDVAFEKAGCTKEEAENLNIVFNMEDYEVWVFIIDFDFNNTHYHTICNAYTTEILHFASTPLT